MMTGEARIVAHGPATQPARCRAKDGNARVYAPGAPGVHRIEVDVEDGKSIWIDLQGDEAARELREMLGESTSRVRRLDAMDRYEQSVHHLRLALAELSEVEEMLDPDVAGPRRWSVVARKARKAAELADHLDRLARTGEVCFGDLNRDERDLAAVARILMEAQGHDPTTAEVPHVCAAVLKASELVDRGTAESRVIAYFLTLNEDLRQAREWAESLRADLDDEGRGEQFDHWIKGWAANLNESQGRPVDEDLAL